jgi:hypothetical protein
MKSGKGRRLGGSGRCSSKLRRSRSEKHSKVGSVTLRWWMRSPSDAAKTAADLAAEEEAKLLAEMERGQKKLASAQELSKGTIYTESLKTSSVSSCK